MAKTNKKFDGDQSMKSWREITFMQWYSAAFGAIVIMSVGITVGMQNGETGKEKTFGALINLALCAPIIGRGLGLW